MSDFVHKPDSVVNQFDPEQNFSGISTAEEIIQYGAWLSMKYAKDGVLAMPSRHHLQSEYDAGRGPGTHFVQDVMGIGNLQRQLGFVTQSALKDWSEEDFLANGTWMSHMLGTPDYPIMPRRPEITAFSKMHLSPNDKNIKRVFGNLDVYQDRLGFVSQETLARWTEQDWIDNGVWLSHMLGSPEEPVMPGEKEVNLASTLNITPSINRIYEHFGSLLNFQREIGFTPAEHPLDYADWDRDTYIENGIWFSHILGDPQHPKMPTSQDIIQGSKLGLVPPETAILKRFRRSIAHYQDSLGFVSRATLRRWTDQDWIDNGVWLSHMLGSPEEPVMPTQDHIHEASKHGLVPPLKKIVEKYPGKLVEYQSLIGFETSKQYNSWTTRDYVRYGLSLVDEKKGRRPDKNDYNAADGPSAAAIQKRFDGMRKFHERLGFPDYEYYDETQVLAHGVNWAFDHEGRVPRKQDITEWRRNQKGPSPWRVRTFYPTISDFSLAIQEALPAFQDLYETISRRGMLPFDAGRHILRDFKNEPEYIEAKKEQAEELRQLMLNSTKLKVLTELFNRSRVTVRWNEDDFIYFGQNALGSNRDSSEKDIETLHTLDKAGLSPYLDELAEVFGSLETFVKTVRTSQNED